MAAGLAPCTNSHRTVLKNVVQLAQEKCPLDVLKIGRMIHRTSHSIDLWINLPQVMSEWPQKPSLTYSSSSSIWPMTMESSTVWEGRTDLWIWPALEGPGTTHPTPSAAGYTFSDIIWLCTLQRHFRGLPTKQVITLSPHLIQKKVLQSSRSQKPSNYTAKSQGSSVTQPSQVS